MNFEVEYMSKLGHRASGFKRIFALLTRQQKVRPNLVIVETGCVRKLDWEGDGCSSVMFDAFAAAPGAEFFSIDINPTHCALARKLCPHSTVLCGDSVSMLYNLRSTIRWIDFLYLDSCDLDWENPHPSALHHLKELCAASALLATGSLVFVDDNRDGKGKGMYVREFLESIGAEFLHDAYKIGFRMP